MRDNHARHFMRMYVLFRKTKVELLIRKIFNIEIQRLKKAYTQYNVIKI